MPDITVAGWVVGLFTSVILFLLSLIVGFLRSLSMKVDALRIEAARMEGAREVAKELALSQESVVSERVHALEASVGKIHARIDELFRVVAAGNPEIHQNPFR